MQKKSIERMLENPKLLEKSTVHIISLYRYVFSLKLKIVKQEFNAEEADL